MGLVALLKEEEGRGKEEEKKKTQDLSLSVR
jgi:hypothetical protein